MPHNGYRAFDISLLKDFPNYQLLNYKIGLKREKFIQLKFMKVELIDLKQRYQEESSQILSCIKKVLSKGHLVLTEELNNFEKNVCKYTGSKYCLGLNSGTDALMMSLWSLGIGKGDEVITSPTSFVATVGAIIHVGATPVFVDIDEDLNIDVNKIEKKLQKKLKQ